MSAHWVWMIVALYGSAAWVATTWIRARYGNSTAGLGGAHGRRPHTRGGRRPASVDDVFESRDATLAELEARIRVLERIATDRRAELEREFERLRTESD